jgi:hypothetical protein
MQTVPGPDDFEPVLAAPEDDQGQPTAPDQPRCNGRMERQPDQPTAPHPVDLADPAERTRDAMRKADERARRIKRPGASGIRGGTSRD